MAYQNYSAIIRQFINRLDFIKCDSSMSDDKVPVVAGLLGLCIPGLGQIYNGQVSKAVIFLMIWLFTFLMWLFLIGLLLTPLWMLLSGYDAYKCATLINEGEEPPFFPI